MSVSVDFSLLSFFYSVILCIPVASVLQWCERTRFLHEFCQRTCQVSEQILHLFSLHSVFLFVVLEKNTHRPIQINVKLFCSSIFRTQSSQENTKLFGIRMEFVKSENGTIWERTLQSVRIWKWPHHHLLYMETEKTHFETGHVHRVSQPMTVWGISCSRESLHIYFAAFLVFPAVLFAQRSYSKCCHLHVELLQNGSWKQNSPTICLCPFCFILICLSFFKYCTFYNFSDLAFG